MLRHHRAGVGPSSSRSMSPRADTGSDSCGGRVDIVGPQPRPPRLTPLPSGKSVVGSHPTPGRLGLTTLVLAREAAALRPLRRLRGPAPRRRWRSGGAEHGDQTRPGRDPVLSLRAVLGGDVDEMVVDEAARDGIEDSLPGRRRESGERRRGRWPEHQLNPAVCRVDALTAGPRGSREALDELTGGDHHAGGQPRSSGHDEVAARTGARGSCERGHVHLPASTPRYGVVRPQATVPVDAVAARRHTPQHVLGR